MNSLIAFAFLFLLFAPSSAFPVDQQIILHTPSLIKPNHWCAGLGGGAFGIAHNFTLVAYNATSSTAEPVPTSLVLRHMGSIAGAELRVLSTYESYPYRDFSTFSLQDGLLFSEHSGVSALGLAVFDGGEPNFITSSVRNASPVRSYCALANTSPHGSNPHSPILAVNGEINGFHLCQQKHVGMGWVLVFRPLESHPRYAPESCYAVRLHLQGLY
ncbi:hypothetical protein QCA50_001045 [Cerrena zonata]|uniref:Uncharacterized protein n=1 Tax=Cerrena zonata TaxID=2478898 RepID=A0AAW0H0P6_9APHY